MEEAAPPPPQKKKKKKKTNKKFIKKKSTVAPVRVVKKKRRRTHSTKWPVREKDYHKPPAEWKGEQNERSPRWRGPSKAVLALQPLLIQPAEYELDGGSAGQGKSQATLVDGPRPSANCCALCHLPAASTMAPNGRKERGRYKSLALELALS